MPDGATSSARGPITVIVAGRIHQLLLDLRRRDDHRLAVGRIRRGSRRGSAPGGLARRGGWAPAWASARPQTTGARRPDNQREKGRTFGAPPSNLSSSEPKTASAMLSQTASIIRDSPPVTAPDTRPRRPLPAAPAVAAAWVDLSDEALARRAVLRPGADHRGQLARSPHRPARRGTRRRAASRSGRTSGSRPSGSRPTACRASPSRSIWRTRG